LIDYGSGIEGCAYIFPRLDPQTGINSIGASMFLSPRNMRALWVRLYLLGEGENFELAHVQSNGIVENVRSQGIEISEIFYYQGIQGPIKIWEINYTGDEEYKEEYVQKNYPKEIKQRSTV
jgi:hypothetical protein